MKQWCFVAVYGEGWLNWVTPRGLQPIDNPSLTGVFTKIDFLQSCDHTLHSKQSWHYHFNLNVYYRATAVEGQGDFRAICSYCAICSMMQAFLLYVGTSYSSIHGWHNYQSTLLNYYYCRGMPTWTQIPNITLNFPYILVQRAAEHNLEKQNPLVHFTQLHLYVGSHLSKQVDRQLCLHDLRLKGGPTQGQACPCWTEKPVVARQLGKPHFHVRHKITALTGQPWAVGTFLV